MLLDSLSGIFFVSFVIGLSGAMMPGPMLMVVVGQSPRRGALTGPVTVLGHGVLEALLVGAVLFGLAEVIRSRAVISVVALAGGVALAYMGTDMLRSAGGMSLKTQSSGASSLTSLHPFWAGIVTSISNPYWTIWWATIGLGYILLARKAGTLGLASFLTGHIAADLAWYSLVSIVVFKGKHWMSDRVYRGLIRFCGVVLFFFAFYFAASAIRGVLA